MDIFMHLQPKQEIVLMVGVLMTLVELVVLRMEIYATHLM